MLRKIIFATLLAAPLVFAQTNENKGSGTKAPTGTEAQPAGGRIRDERVTVENMTFWKKNATDGKGDYLEFTFDIVNKTEDNIPLKMFIIAFNERDLVDAEYRRYVEYPKWRKWDEDKKMHKLVLYNSIPETKHEEVAAFARKKEEAVAKNGGYKPKEEEPQPAGNKKKSPTLKQFLQYVQYIHENPNSGLDVMLQGFEDTKFTRKVEPTYRIEEKALKTNVWGKLLSRYRVDRKFFNHIGLVLYDTEAKKIVHRQFYSINGKFKIL
ncbi:MAG: hypothetical protein J0L53_02195 [Spirochaetes bacterium]|nr:hypothetical protein [Spirochaetota bacterium]MBX3721721.1 hypothetical protein [Turneriella sp.]